jgi:hypothetical protein
MTDEDAPTHAEKPDWQPFWLACKKCGHEWDDWIPVHVPVEAAVAYMRSAYRCLRCNAGFDAMLWRSTPLKRVFD